MRRLWVFLLLGFLLAGCGSGDKAEVNEQEKVINTGGSGIVAGEMEASLTEKSPLIFEYEVKNQTEAVVALEFSSSQRFDYSVRNQAGEEVFLFSSVANFLQALGTETIKQGASLSYEIDLHELNLQKGKYVLSVCMTPMGGKKYKVTKEFTAGEA
jgi:hypothetical protein